MKDSMRPGVLSTLQIRELARQGTIKNAQLDHMEEDKISNESAFDLHLGDVVFEMRGGIKGTKDDPYDAILRKFGKESSLTGDGKVLQRFHTYVVPLQEQIIMQNSRPIFGCATGKSSIGRLGALTRLIADYSECYDLLPNPSDAVFSKDKLVKLFIEITPMPFPIVVYPGITLNQLRLFWGAPDLSRIPIELLELYEPEIVVGERGGRLPKLPENLSVNLEATDIGGGVMASAFRTDDDVLKEGDSKMPIDLRLPRESLDPQKFWSTQNKGLDNTLDIFTESFYIIRSKERFRLPPDVAVYAQAMAESFGELRIHYAGFIHPCFGFTREDGAPLIFEIRSHNVSTLLTHGEALAKLQFYRMSESAQNDPSYGNQELTLSRIFRDWSK